MRRQAVRARPELQRDHDEISVRPGRLDRLARGLGAARRGDPLRAILWVAAAVLGGYALTLRRAALGTSAPSTLLAFATLAAVVAAGLVADRLGLFRLAAHLLLHPSTTDRAAVGWSLALTALLSGLINLDVAVVVAVPLGLELAGRRRLRGDRLAAAIALTANATSFLLPTSNLTTLLLLDRAPIPLAAFARASWLPWLLVTGVTVVPLALLVARSARDHPCIGSQPRRWGPAALLDLVPIFVIAVAIRALLAGGVLMRGGGLAELAASSLLAAGLDNLPAAAALRATGPGVPWPAVLGLAIGPNLVLTGSLASLISRRIARDRGAGFAVGWFTGLAWLLVPVQLLAAVAGLRLSGGL